MKIVMIGQKGIPAQAGGIERHVEELSAQLVQRGHEVLVFCRSWYVKNKKIHRGVHCVNAYCIRTKHLDAITHTFFSILKAVKLKPDIIHIHGVGPALLAWLPKLISPKTKVVVTFHCIDRHHQKWNWFGRLSLYLGERIACWAPDATVSVSKTLQTYCRLSYGTNTAYIPNGAHIPDTASDPDLLKKFKLETGKYLMMCSRLVRHKGVHVLIDAWKRLRIEQPKLTRNMKLAIVGGSAFTDDYVKEVHEMAAGDDSIVFTDTQTGKTLHALFSGAYAQVHPSASEGLPIAVLEGMGYGKCVIASDIPENSELVTKHGISFKTGDVENLVKKMTMILTEPKLSNAVGSEARDFIAKNFDWTDIAETTEYLYESLDFKPNINLQRSSTPLQ